MTVTRVTCFAVTTLPHSLSHSSVVAGATNYAQLHCVADDETDYVTDDVTVRRKFVVDCREQNNEEPKQRRRQQLQRQNY